MKTLWFTNQYWNKIISTKISKKCAQSPCSAHDRWLNDQSKFFPDQFPPKARQAPQTRISHVEAWEDLVFRIQMINLNVDEKWDFKVPGQLRNYVKWRRQLTVTLTNLLMTFSIQIMTFDKNRILSFEI